MKEYGILKTGTIIIIAPPYGRRGRNEYYEIVSFEEEINNKFNRYLAYKLNSNKDKVIGAKTSIRFPKTDETDNRFNYNYWLVKEGNGELVVSKDIEDSILQQQGTGAVLKYDGEKPPYLMTREEYKKYIKPFWDKVFDLPKKYPQYFYNRYGYEIITSEEEIPSLINDNDKNDYSSNWRYKEWVEKNKVEPKRIPAEIKKAYEEDLKLLKEKVFNAYIDTDLKTNNKKIISKAIEDGVYAELIKKGQLNTFALKEILDSVKLKLPNKLEKAQAEVSIEGLTYEKEIENKENLKKFKDDIVSYFKEYYDKIRNNYIKYKTKRVEEFIDFSKNNKSYSNSTEIYIDFSDYLKIDYKKEYNPRYKEYKYDFDYAIKSFFSTRGLFNNGFKLVSNWENVIDKLATEEAEFIFDTYVSNLIIQIPINVKSKLPKIIWGEIKTYSQTGFDSKLILEFENGFRLNVENKTIYAGGYNIQQLHLRTIFNFSIDGKVLSDAEIQKAYKDFVPVKEKEVISASSDKEYLEKKLIASKELLEVLDATQGDEKDIEYVKNMIEVTKDLIYLLK